MVKRKLLQSYLEFIQQDSKKEDLLEFSATAMLGAISPWLSGLMSATLILRYGSTLMNDYLTKSGRACNHLEGASKNLCAIDYKIRAMELEKNTLKSKQGLCAKSRNVQECRDKVQRKIDVLDRQLRDLYEHKNIFRDKARKEREAQMGVM